jgi:hypothetical protein
MMLNIERSSIRIRSFFFFPTGPVSRAEVVSNESDESTFGKAMSYNPHREISCYYKSDVVKLDRNIGQAWRSCS